MIKKNKDEEIKTPGISKVAYYTDMLGAKSIEVRHTEYYDENKLSQYYDFQKWTMITFSIVAISLVVGLVLLSLQFAQGQEWNTTQQTEQNNTNAVFMRYKGEYYCYDSDTTTKKEVIEAIKHDWMTGETEMENDLLTSMAEPDNPNNMTEKAESLQLAKTLCQSMVDNGNFANEDYNDYIEGTLTFDFK